MIAKALFSMPVQSVCGSIECCCYSLLQNIGLCLSGRDASRRYIIPIRKDGTSEVVIGRRRHVKRQRILPAADRDCMHLSCSLQELMGVHGDGLFRRPIDATILPELIPGLDFWEGQLLVTQHQRTQFEA